jgi:hypothetical protein
MTAPYAGCVNCRFNGPDPGPSGCRHPDRERPGFFEEETTAACWTPRPPVEYQWHPTRPGPGWELVEEQDCVTYTRRLWRRTVEPAQPVNPPTA